MSDGPTDCDCKVGRSIASYDLTRMNERLRERYAGSASLRDVTDDLNEAMLGTVLERSGALADIELFGALDERSTLETIYERLSGEGTTAERVRVETRLEQAGVDLEALRDDWVTHPTVRTHLRECLGVDTSAGASIDPDDATDTIAWARTRTERIVANTLSRLATAGEVEYEDVDVHAAIQVTCQQCGRTTSVDSFVAAGGCSCGDS